MFVMIEMRPISKFLTFALFNKILYVIQYIIKFLSTFVYILKVKFNSQVTLRCMSFIQCYAIHMKLYIALCRQIIIIIKGLNFYVKLKTWCLKLENNFLTIKIQHKNRLKI